MAPKHAPAKLSALSLSDDEIDAAKKILAAADQKKMNSIKAGLKNFLSANPDEQVTKENRYSDGFIQAFLVHQSRCNDAAKRVVAAKKVTVEKSKLTDVIRMSVSKMNSELGLEKAELWRSVLKGMPDLLTGRTEPQFLEYSVPVNWERMGNQELHEFLIEANGEASKDDIQKALEIQGTSMDMTDAISSSSGINPVEVKVEPATKEEIEKKALAMKVAELQQQLPDVVQEFQTMLLDSRLVLTKAKTKGDIYHEAFRNDLELHIKKVKTTKDVLE